MATATSRLQRLTRPSAKPSETSICSALSPSSLRPSRRPRTCAAASRQTTWSGPSFGCCWSTCVSTLSCTWRTTGWTPRTTGGCLCRSSARASACSRSGASIWTRARSRPSLLASTSTAAASCSSTSSATVSRPALRACALACVPSLPQHLLPPAPRACAAALAACAAALAACCFVD